MRQFQRKFMFLIEIVLYFRTCECGVSDFDGKNAQKQFPWQLLLTINWKGSSKKQKDETCGGVLISEKHFLTSVTCLQQIGHEKSL